MKKMIFVTAAGVTHALAQDVEQLWQVLSQGKVPVSSSGIIKLDQFAVETILEEDRARRMDRVSQILAVTAKKVMQAAGEKSFTHLNNIGMCMSTDLGTIDSVVNFSKQIFTSGPRRANPMVFPNTVINASTGHACITTGLKGHNNTVSGSGALGEAFDALSLGRAQGIVAAGLEEVTPLQQQTVSEIASGQPAPCQKTEMVAGWLRVQRVCCWNWLNSHRSGKPSLGLSI